MNATTQSTATQSTAAPITLSVEELAFLRAACELFPGPESPLRYLEDGDRQPESWHGAHKALAQRGLLVPNTARARPDLAARLSTVAECSARVCLAVSEGPRQKRREFYVAEGRAVEHSQRDGVHCLGAVRSESELAAELSRCFAPQARTVVPPLHLTPGAYLVFAMYARDVRAAPKASDPEAPMSIDEVLAYFDEPEAKSADVPTDDDWQASVESLVERGVLVAKGGAFELHSAYHALAREIDAEHQSTISRCDFFDERWLTRELHLFPAGELVYRLAPQPDGCVLLESLAAAELAARVKAVVSTLPIVLGAESTVCKPVAGIAGAPRM